MPLPDVAFLIVAGMAAAAAGAAAGSGLLLVTGSDLFRQLVPFLVAAGSCVLLAAPRLTYWYAKTGRDRARSATFAVALISVYGGYFGAGSGVMLLAATLVLTSRRITEANASKNMYLGAGGVASALILTTAAPVPWTSVGGPGRRIARGQSCRPTPRSATAGGDPPLGRGNPRLCARRHPLR